MSSRNLPRPRSLASAARLKSDDTKQRDRPIQANHPSDQPNVPQSNMLLAGLDIAVIMPRQTLDLEHHAGDNDDAGIPQHPRRLWKVDDAKLPIFPDLYPPPNPRESCVVTDAPPSVIAIRISECLRRRSVAVEYDEETCTATGITVDRCCFQIHVWSVHDNTEVLVECMKQRGSAQTYHWTVQAILQAAQSLDSGDDRRAPYQTSTTEFSRLFSKEEHTISSQRLVQSSSDFDSPTKASEKVLASLEHAWHLLGKDRCEAQQLGMESIVHLTDFHTAGADKAMFAALAVLGALASLGHDISLQDIHRRWIYGLIVNRSLPEEPLTATNEDVSVVNTLEDDMHVGRMRSLALRVVANALTILSEYQATVLEDLLHTTISQWTSKELIDSLVEDLQGSYRPPTAALRLSTPHEAVLALQCLECLTKHNAATAKYIFANQGTLSLLDGARSVGRSTNSLLHELSSQIYEQLTEEHRSC